VIDDTFCTPREMLAIVRYGHGIGLQELKLAYATETETTFADGTVQRDVPLLHNPAIWHVSYALLCKKHIVQSVVERDLDPLTSFLDDEGQQVPTHFEILKTRHVHIRAFGVLLPQVCAAVRAWMDDAGWPRRSPKKLPGLVRSNSDNVEQRDPPLKDMATCLLKAHGNGPRFKKLANNALLAKADVKITSLSGTPLALKGATLLDMTDAAVLAECQALLHNRDLETITAFQLERAHHYGIYRNGTLVTYLCLLIGKLGPVGSIAVSIEWLASIDKEHTASRVVAEIKKLLSRRKQKCALFTQSSKKTPTVAFWDARIGKSQWATVFVVAFYQYDARCVIYEDSCERGGWV
jgi:hypothetical protein